LAILLNRYSNYSDSFVVSHGELLHEF